MAQQETENFSTISGDVFTNLITTEEAANLAKLAISSDAQLIDYKICPYSENMLGVAGTHLKLTLDTTKPGNNKNETRSFFVKTMPVDAASQADSLNENGTFRKETEFFREIEPLMMKNYKCEAWGPKCYLVKGAHTLVFDDLGTKGFFNRDKFLDEACVMSAVACIARLHASSLLAEELLHGKSLFDLYPSAFEESEYRKTGRQYQWFTACVDYLILLTKEMGLDYSRLAEACDLIFDVCVPSKTKRNVLSHGDLWSNNMIFDKDNRCRIVDYQLTRYAPMAHDLMFLLYSCTPREFREDKEALVVDHYYKTLQETLKICDYKGVVPSFEELQKGVEEQRLPALAIAAVTFQVIAMDAKKLTEIVTNTEMYEEYFFKSRRPLIDDIMAQDPVFAKKIKDTSIELVEMSLKYKDFPKVT